MNERPWGQVGETYGRLTIIRGKVYEDGRGVRRKARVICQCSCDAATILDVDLGNLRSGRTKSCGCLQRERAAESSATHNLSRHPLFQRWQAMMNRCYEETNVSYRNYGERGITVCREWHDVANYIAWAEQQGWSEGLTIDRINNDLGYCPSNCRLASMTEQGNNRRNNHILEYRGKSQTVAQWSRELGIRIGTIFNRLRLGWTVEDALRTPVKQTERMKSIAFQGKEQPLSAWSMELGIKLSILRDRLGKLNWSVEKAFTTPAKQVLKILDAH
jgi:hypothetical protein